MSTQFRLISFNCQSVNTNRELIELLLRKCEILVLQETLVTEHNKELLETFTGRNFGLAYVPAIRDEQTSVGRASGGLAIYYRHCIDLTCETITFSSRFLGIKLKCGEYSCLIVNCYFNCDYRTDESLLEYLNNVSVLANILTNESFDDIIILGDLNCDPSKGRFYDKLNALVKEFALYPLDISELPASSYTYISHNETASTSWLDHILCSRCSIACNVEILYGITFTDHIPIMCEIRLPCKVEVSALDDTLTAPHGYNIPWETLSDDHLLTYSANLEFLARYMWYDVLACNDSNCNNSQHKSQLTALFSSMKEGMHLASEHLMKNDKGKFKHVIGWNRHCKTLYSNARENYLLWHEGGRVRNGSLFDAMKNSRAEFKRALRYCRENEAQLRKDILLEKFLTSGKNSKEFWKEVRKSKISQAKCPRVIDGLHDGAQIINVFDTKYKAVLNNPDCQVTREDDGQPDPNYPFTVSIPDLRDAVKRLKLGKGWDQIHVNHFKFMGPIFENLVCKFINRILSHNFVPREMLKGEIRPVTKSDKLDRESSENYRPVMNSSAFLKVFEYILLPCLERFLKIDSHQFGYRRDTGCLNAVTVLKETVLKYNKEGSNVHCAMVDLSKAYDCVNIDKLVGRLRNTGMPGNVVDIISYMGKNTFVRTLFNGIRGSDWQVGNGTRQGGVMSGLLFNFYLNELMKEICALPQGCKLAGTVMNIICYADDILLLAPSVTGLQVLIDNLVFRLRELSLKVNVQKSSYIVFKRNCYSIDREVFISGTKLNRVSRCVYLGVTLTDNMSVSEDVERAMNTFLRQFNSIYYRFYRSKGQVLNHLFRSHAMTFYGMETWSHNLTKQSLRKVSVAYHGAVKRTCGMNKWDGNHVACETVGVDTFKHLHARRLISYTYALLNSRSPCLVHLSNYFRFMSQISSNVEKFFSDNYQLANVYSNPLCAVIARIQFVQRNEPRLSDLRNIYVSHV